MTIVAELGSSEHVVVSVGDVYTPTRGLFHDPRQVDLEGRRGRCDLGSDVGPQHGTIRNPKGFSIPQSSRGVAWGVQGSQYAAREAAAAHGAMVKQVRCTK